MNDVEGIGCSHTATSEHSVQFYEDDAFLLESVSRFIGTGLQAGQAGVVIATEAHRHGLEKRLKERGVDLIGARKRGQYIPLDAASTLSKFMVEGQPDEGRFVEVIGTVMAKAGSCHSRVRAFGEMVALLWADQKSQAAIQVERLWNTLSTIHTFSLLCAYPMGVFERDKDAYQYRDVFAEHSRVIPTERYMRILRPDEHLRAIAELQHKAQALGTETEKRREAQKALDQICELNACLESVREEERARIAQEIHDELGQALTGLKLDIAWLKQHAEDVSPAVLAKLDSMARLADTTIHTVRDIATELRPVVLDKLGLLPALEWLGDEFQSRTGIQFKFNFQIRRAPLSRERSTAVFRIFQEVLTNIARHAAAPEVTVVVREISGHLVIEVADNGRGITKAQLADVKSLGLLSMRERAALLGGETVVQGTAGQGTKVKIRMPLGEPWLD